MGEGGGDVVGVWGKRAGCLSIWIWGCFFC